MCISHTQTPQVSKSFFQPIEDTYGKHAGVAALGIVDRVALSTCHEGPWSDEIAGRSRHRSGRGRVCGDRLGRIAIGSVYIAQSCAIKILKTS